MPYNGESCEYQSADIRTDIVIEVGVMGPRGPRGSGGDLTDEDKEKIKNELLASIDTSSLVGVDAIPDDEIRLML